MRKQRDFHTQPAPESKPDLPPVLGGPLEHLASLCTPIPMLFIGYSLSKVDLIDILKRPQNYGLCALRLVVVPLVSAGILYLIGLRGTLLLAATIATAKCALIIRVTRAATRECLPQDYIRFARAKGLRERRVASL